MIPRGDEKNFYEMGDYLGVAPKKSEQAVSVLKGCA